MENHSMKKNRSRGENWLRYDKKLLTDIVKPVVEIVESKKTDTTSNQNKLATWREVTHRFNELCKGCPRTYIQLKGQWRRLKRAARKIKSNKSTDLNSPPNEISQNSNNLEACSSTDFVEIEYDSDEMEDEPESSSETEITPIEETMTPLGHGSLVLENHIPADKMLLFAETEMRYKTKLYQIQMQCERQRLINLELEEKILLSKLNNKL